MSARSVGAVVSISPYDNPLTEPEEGDVVQTSTGRSYRIVSARRVRSKYPNRWALRCVVIEQSAVQPDDVVHPLYWYAR